VVGIFMNQLMQGKPLTVFGDGLQTRAFSYIGDVAPWIARSPETGAALNQVFNIGADKEHSVKALAEATMDALGLHGELRYLPARPEVVHAYADHAKARRIFGIDSPVSLEDGLRQMASWAKKAGIRKSRRFDAIEIERGLPTVWLED
jgi:UDP-glucose 4-epimerase